MAYTGEQRRAYDRAYTARKMQDPEYVAKRRGYDKKRAPKRAVDKAYLENKKEWSRAYRVNRRQSPEYVEKVRAVAREWYSRGVGTGRVTTQEAWIKRTVYVANKRAARCGFPGALLVSDVELATTCPILGVEIVYGGRSDNSASLDKVVPSKGYVAGNVRVVSRRANRLKADATLAELRAIVRYVEEST